MRNTGAVTALTVVCAVYLALPEAQARPPPHALDMSWETNYAYWRDQEPVSFATWKKQLPKAVRNPKDRTGDTWTDASASVRDEWHHECLETQMKRFGKEVLKYQSPRLEEVQEQAKRALAEQGKRVAVAIFWGRGRYVKILWPYIERNLRQQEGIVDEVILITKNRDSSEGAQEARAILTHAIEKYPGVVKEVPFCRSPYGCAYNDILTDNSTVYVKIDDDIVFVKDGSIEHLVLQQITNDDYAFYSASIVNNPHSYGVHAYAGAYPPVLYHWWEWHVTPRPPFVPAEDAYHMYYGKNVYPSVGSRAHEAFIYNAAHGRLDVYTFGLFNMHECKCGIPQEGLDYCVEGFYRWSINGFVFEARNNVLEYGVPKFDEPAIGIGWTAHSKQRRTAIVGESLLVHMQYTRQRTGKPSFGLREDIMLPWYEELQRQYTAQPFGVWHGNETLLGWYEDMAWHHGEDRFGRDGHSARPADQRIPIDRNRFPLTEEELEARKHRKSKLL